MKTQILVKKSWLCLWLVIAILSSASITNAGTPHGVGGTVKYSNLSSPATATFSAYILSRPGEILTQSSAGCSYVLYLGIGYYSVQVGNFPTSWTAGDVLHVDLSDGLGGTASGQVTLTNDPQQVLDLTIISATPDISASPNPAAFGSVNVGSYSDITVVVSNTGTGNLNITGSSLSGSGSAQFNIQSGSGATIITPGNTSNIVVRFSPSAAVSYSASLDIASDDPDEGTYSVALTGTGVCSTLPQQSVPSPSPPALFRREALY